MRNLHLNQYKLSHLLRQFSNNKTIMHVFYFNKIKQKYCYLIIIFK